MKNIRNIQLERLEASKRVHSVGFLSKTSYFYWLRILIWSLDLPKAPYIKLGQRIFHLWTVNGATFMVKYCKECVRILQAYVSGTPIFTTCEFVVGIKGGIPSIIPGTLSLGIRRKDHKIIRGVLSLLSVYRVVKIPGKLKLESITEPFKGLSTTLPLYEVIRATSELKWQNHFKLKPIRLKALSTAGPNVSPSMFGIVRDIQAWMQRPDLLLVLSNYLEKVPGGPGFLTLIRSEMARLALTTRSSFEGGDGFEHPLNLGRLSLKMEAAGKVRVFAIVDSITQSVMQPLSDGIFQILKHLPMDGTFDQDRPVRHLLNILKNRSTTDLIYSYDLSSATDRLPIDVQGQVLSIILGNDLADCWKRILTDREWWHSSKLGGNLWLRYSVGQPMGALSSWAMLALTHHMIVRLAANREGIPNFTDYALLGDDIVIANSRVASQYHYLMTQVLGVEINLSKSLVSYDSFEFAKRLVTMKGEVSPVGAKNLLVAVKTLKGIPSIYLDLHNKGVTLTSSYLEDHITRFPNPQKGKLKSILWLVQGPFGFVPTTSGVSASQRLNTSLSVVYLYQFVQRIEQIMYRANLSVWERNMIKLGDIICLLLDKAQCADFGPKTAEPGFRFEQEDIRCYLDEYWIRHGYGSSPIFEEILSLYYEEWSKLLSQKPQPALFHGFKEMKLHHSDPSFYRKIHEYISHLVKNDPRETSLPFNPFEDEKVVLYLSHSTKVENFWLEVEKTYKSKPLL